MEKIAKCLSFERSRGKESRDEVIRQAKKESKQAQFATNMAFFVIWNIQNFTRSFENTIDEFYSKATLFVTILATTLPSRSKVLLSHRE